MTSKRNSQDYGKVAVLFGGNSAEREVSLRSGKAVLEGLLGAGINAVKIDPAEGLIEQLYQQGFERAFIVLHGRDGEDGVVQGFLKLMNIPFTGSDVAGSAIAMNKSVSKQIWKQHNIDTAEFLVVNKRNKFTLEDAKNVFTEQGPVLFVKPVKEGSSVGMSKVKTADELMKAVALAHQYDPDALVESFISGKEYTVTLLNGKALPSIRMQTPREFYDYEAKYQSTTTQYFCPSGLNKEDELELGEIAISAFDALGCSGWGRVDFIREDETSKFLILEANTVPGMTETSLVPKAAKAVGISFQELVVQILETSFDSQEIAND